MSPTKKAGTRRVAFFRGLIGCVVVFFLSCGESELNRGEDYGNLLESPSGLVLTQEEHEAGWGHSQCTTCHNLENIHLVNRTGIALDIEAIYNQALAEGIDGCAACHGDNGVTP